MTADVTAAMARLRKLVTDAKPALMDDPAWSAQFFRVDDDLALVAQALAEREGMLAAARRYVNAGVVWSITHRCRAKFGSKESDATAEADLALMEARDALASLLPKEAPHGG